MESINYVYATQAEVEVWASQQGLQAFTTDDKSGIAPINLWATAAVYATRDVDLYCGRFYDPSALYPSYLVHEWAVFICAYRVMKRRGNPAPDSVLEDYQETIERLEMIRDGKLKLPGVPVRNTHAPTLTNYSINDNWGFAKLRRDPVTSVGPLTPTSMVETAWPGICGWPGFTGYYGS
jgi:phage gp36-like protein